jgi:hypothetical protein
VTSRHGMMRLRNMAQITASPNEVAEKSEAVAG